MEYIDIGQRIKFARQDKNISQEKLSDMCGCKASHISHIETGRSSPRWTEIEDIAYAMGMSSHKLLYGYERDSLTINDYQVAALRTAPIEISLKELLVNASLGLCGESGEVADLVKKALFQGHELDIDHVAKELGDIAWYLAIGAFACEYDLQTVLQMNVDKLKERYPDGFDAERSMHRRDGDV